MSATAEARVITDIPPRARARWRMDELRTERVTAGAVTTSYGIGGAGVPVLFLHGWGLDHRAYQSALRRLTTRGCRVIAPSMPGFGGTSALPPKRRTLAGYASWVGDFLDAIEVDQPVLALGHSFGGGVATKFAHDAPGRVRYLVLLNSVGDPGTFPRPPRPSWSALVPSFEKVAAYGRLERIAIDNFVRSPRAVLDAGRIARSADLSAETSALAERGLPALVLWSDQDTVIPIGAFDTFCSTFGTEGHVVRGGHSWLLADPDVFGEVLENVIQVQRTDHERQTTTSTTANLLDLLRHTTMPRRTARRLLADVSPLWAMSEHPAVLAGDIALCHPGLEPDEVRAVARPIDELGAFRLTVVATDRPGLLADTAATLASDGISVISASVMTWPTRRQALHSLTVRADRGVDGDRWARIGEQLRGIARGEPYVLPFVPCGGARVTRTGGGQNTTVVRVTAPDQLGLLAAICRWFADHGASIRAADVATVDGVANDVFLVDGDIDTRALARRLRGDRQVTPCTLLRSALALLPA